MNLDIELLKQVREEQLETAGFLQEKIKNISRDKNGGSTAGLSGTLRMIAILDFLIDQNVHSFRNRLAQSARVYLKLFERFSAEEPISHSYISMQAYKELLDALASGDMPLSINFAQLIGGHETIEKEYDAPFTIAMGYTLKYLVLDDNENTKLWLEKLLTLCDGEQANFKGYVAMMEAIFNKDEIRLNATIISLIDGHKRETKGKGMFSDLLDEYLAVWAVGLANLAKRRGLSLSTNTELIPEILIS